MKDNNLNDKKYTTESKTGKQGKKKDPTMKGNNLNYIKFNTEIKQKNYWN